MYSSITYKRNVSKIRRVKKATTKNKTKTKQNKTKKNKSKKKKKHNLDTNTP